MVNQVWADREPGERGLLDEQETTRNPTLWCSKFRSHPSASECRRSLAPTRHLVLPGFLEKQGGITMATVLSEPAIGRPIDLLSGELRAHRLDHWIYVITAVGFIIITLTGFIPDSLMKLELAKAGQRPPFPVVAHFHAVLMGGFLLLLLCQTVLMTTGRRDLHRQIGPVVFLFAPALIVVGFLLASGSWYGIWHAAHDGPMEIRAAMLNLSSLLDNLLLLQIQVGILFPLFLFVGLRARKDDPGFHKRMMIIAPAMALPAAFDRITWIPTTMPLSPMSAELYPLLALAPLVAWDLFRNRRIHRAYWVLLAVYVPAAIAANVAWDQPWWHETVRRMMGV